MAETSESDQRLDSVMSQNGEHNNGHGACTPEVFSLSNDAENTEPLPADEYFRLKPLETVASASDPQSTLPNQSESCGESIKRQSDRLSASRGSSKSSRHSRTPEFDFETRFVVLNYLGLVPMCTSNLNASGTSSSEGNAASLLYSQASVESGKSAKSAMRRSVQDNAGDWSALPKLPTMSTMEKFHDTIDSHKTAVSANGDGQYVVAAGRRKSINQWGGGGGASQQECDGRRSPHPLSSYSDTQIGRRSERRVNVQVEDDASDTLSEPRRGGAADVVSVRNTDVRTNQMHVVQPPPLALRGASHRRNRSHEISRRMLDSLHANNPRTASSAATPNLNVVNDSTLSSSSSNRMNKSMKRSGSAHQFSTETITALNATDDVLRETEADDLEYDEVDALPFMEDDEDVGIDDGTATLQAKHAAALVNNNVHAKATAQRPSSISLGSHFRPQAPLPGTERTVTPLQPSSDFAAVPPTQGSVTPPPTAGYITPPPPPSARKSPCRWQRAQLTKSYTMDSDRSLSRPEYSYQFSQRSENSSFSDADSALLSNHSCSVLNRSGTIDLATLDLDTVTPLVERKMLPPEALELKQELDEELLELEQCTGINAGMLSPESRIVAYLSYIGDKVQATHGDVLEQTFTKLTSQPRDSVGYEAYSSAAEQMTKGTSKVTTVALLLVLSKRIAYSFYNKGERGINHVVDYTARAIEDLAADFIVEKGGWNSIKDIAPDEYPMLLNEVVDIQQGLNYDVSPGDSLDHDVTATSGGGTAVYAQESTMNVTAPPVATGSAMNTSTLSDGTDTTLIDVKGKELSLEELHSLTVAGSSASQNAPFEHYSDADKPRSRHGSGNTDVTARRGSYNFIPHAGHLLSRSSFNSTDTDGLNVIQRDDSDTSSCRKVPSRVGSEDQASGGSEVFEVNQVPGCNQSAALENDDDVSAENSTSRVQFTMDDDDADDTLTLDDYDSNYARVEGTMDPDISRDAMLLRQLSMELTREREAARERERQFDALTAIAVVLAVAAVTGIILWRRKQ